MDPPLPLQAPTPLLSGHAVAQQRASVRELASGRPGGQAGPQAARAAIGNETWRQRVHQMIANMRTLVMFDRLYIGGGNARPLQDDLPADVECVDNRAGILGGAWLWKDCRRASRTTAWTRSS